MLVYILLEVCALGKCACEILLTAELFTLYPIHISAKVCDYTVHRQALSLNVNLTAHLRRTVVHRNVGDSHDDLTVLYADAVVGGRLNTDIACALVNEVCRRHLREINGMLARGYDTAHTEGSAAEGIVVAGHTDQVGIVVHVAEACGLDNIT